MIPTRWIPTLLAALLLAAAAPGLAGDAPPPPPDPPGEEAPPEAEPPPPDPETVALLGVLDRTHGKIRSLEAPYLQVRKVRISRRLRKSKGVMYVRKGEKPGAMQVLFRETEPFEATALFTETEVVYRDGVTGEVKRYDPAQGGVKPSEIWVLGRPVAEIRKHYAPRRVPLETDEEREAYGAKLELVPTSEKIAKWVRKVIVWLRPGDALGLKVRIVDRTGDWQEFAFDEKGLKINPELGDDLFEVR